MKHEIKVPEVGEAISEVVIAEWLKQDGDYVERDEPICEIESEKASFEVPADEAGVLETKAEEGDTIAVGAVLAVVDTEAEAPETPETGPEEETEEEPVPEQEEAAAGEVKISPVASNILKEAGIQAKEVRGTGVGGKITKADARRATQEKETAEPARKEQPPEEKREAPAEQPAEKKAPLPGFTGDRSVKKEPMSTLRKTIAQRLVSAKNDTAMLTTFNDVDMTGVITTRNKYKELFEKKHDVRLGFMSFFTRACCIAMEDFPILNARLEDDQIVYHQYVDMGIAVSTDRGLVVPIIRNADKLSFADLERQINELASKARDNKLTIDEMRGGTFSITNGGVFGSLLSTPILNAPQSAILGMHRIEERPVAVHGEVTVRPMMYLALSYDHRIIDGKDSVQFLVRLKELIEDPERMLIDV
ncbi:MAG TPA: 2-oxoglutarate dehydrogenase complex dihydrolipoyllysine-residue succinyltransferase [bacterium]|nr:2-oxoglutarate dehydrogenase complex dihydrolipoyllysine-residue succinyltransferase [bacterium]